MRTLRFRNLPTSWESWSLRERFGVKPECTDGQGQTAALAVRLPSISMFQLLPHAPQSARTRVKSGAPPNANRSHTVVSPHLAASQPYFTSTRARLTPGSLRLFAPLSGDASFTPIGSKDAHASALFFRVSSGTPIGINS
jgi:hypothetical protein